MCPVVGAELTRKHYPYLPITPDEIAEAAVGAVNAGATVIHLHVRDKDGKPSQRVDIFKQVTTKIRQRCDCIIEYSAGGAVGVSLEERCGPLYLKPEMASLSMGTMNFGKEIFENTVHTIETLARTMISNEITPEAEIFDFGMLETALRFSYRKLIPEKFHVGLGFGIPGGMAATIDNLAFMVNKLSFDQVWTAGAVGRFQLPITTHAIAMGGHVRVGIEDNIYYRRGQLAKSNAELIDRTVRIAKELERPIATIEQAREILL